MTTIARPMMEPPQAAMTATPGPQDKPYDDRSIARGDASVSASAGAGGLGALADSAFRGAKSRKARSERRPRGVSIAEMALAAATGLVAARLAFLVAAPLPTPDRMPESAAQPLSGDGAAAAGPVNPFRVAQGQPAPAAEPVVDAEEALEETALNLVLHGVRLDGDATTAIIQTADGGQEIFSLGDTVAPNVVLESARREQVTLRRNGVRESLTMINRNLREAPEFPPVRAAGPSGAESAETSDPTATAGGGRAARRGGGTRRPATLDDWTELVRIDTRLQDGGSLRVVLNPGPRGAAFRAAGLRPGDVLLLINGRPLGDSPAAISRRLQSLAGAESADLVVERDGVRLPLTVSLLAGDGDVDE